MNGRWKIERSSVPWARKTTPSSWVLPCLDCSWSCGGGRGRGERRGRGRAARGGGHLVRVGVPGAVDVVVDGHEEAVVGPHVGVVEGVEGRGVDEVLRKVGRAQGQERGERGEEGQEHDGVRGRGKRRAEQGKGEGGAARRDEERNGDGDDEVSGRSITLTQGNVCKIQRGKNSKLQCPQALRKSKP